ncbi:hypothetical protein IW261DRAFT_352595 [Armillaria novae-zelandiae]|uniref:Uncharacterized protein n=1 Tax=Armillaria novae-zelandiae TaxID=153914 RepID=A0AA39PRI4_9AGAR|nr:hypothetical protein IW261DRAFT_352595 [Armillaria novae-zelandiae]
MLMQIKISKSFPRPEPQQILFTITHGHLARPLSMDAHGQHVHTYHQALQFVSQLPNVYTLSNCIGAAWSRSHVYRCHMTESVLPSCMSNRSNTRSTLGDCASVVLHRWRSRYLHTKSQTLLHVFSMCRTFTLRSIFFIMSGEICCCLPSLIGLSMPYGREVL